MAKKKTEDFEVDMMTTEVNDEEKKEVINASEELHEETPIEEVPTTEPEAVEQPTKKKRASKKRAAEPAAEVPEEPDLSRVEEKAPKTKKKNAPKDDSILTIEVGGVVRTDEELAEIAWHEIHNAFRTRKILTGMLGGIEVLDSGNTVAVVDYKGYRVIIPVKEMAVLKYNNMEKDEHRDFVLRQQKLLNNMLGAEIDFIVKGIDSKTRSVVASRKDAMLKKRKTFYMETDADGAYKIYDGRIVQARVLAVAEKGIRVEVFGVECSIMSRHLSWEWLGDARDHYSTGDEILVRILSVDREDAENINIKADVKSVNDNGKRPDLSICRIQGKYAGKVTDVHKGIVFIRLTNGINAIAHSCLDRRMPAKKDDVSFAVTRLDEDNGVAVGIITRIIKQNL